MPVSPNLRMYAWAAGSWLSQSGRGTITSTIVPGNTAPAADPFTDIFGGRPGSGSIDDSTFRRSYYGIGLGLRWEL